MKAKTKIDKEVVEYGKQLKSLISKEIKYIKDKLAVYFYTISRNRCYCLACGHKDNINNFKPISNYDVKHDDQNIAGKQCPACKKKLRYSYKYFNTDTIYVAKLEVLNNYQIIRIFEIIHNSKLKQNSVFSGQEVIRYWIKDNGRYTMETKLSFGFNSNFKGALEPRSKFSKIKYLNTIADHTFVKSLLPVIKRNGFIPNITKDLPLPKLVLNLITNPKFECLYKLQQYDICHSYLNQNFDINLYWPQLLICFKHKYVIKHVSIWIDYLKLLKEFNKDLHNPYYICPKDLNKNHDYFVNKKRILERKKNIQLLYDQININQAKYNELKNHLLNLEFTSENITLSTIKTIQEFYDLSQNLNLCLFENQYYNKKNSLLFTVSKEKTILEVMELRLDDMDILQIYGPGNQPSKYKQEVVEILYKNKTRFKKALTQNKKYLKCQNLLNIN